MDDIQIIEAVERFLEGKMSAGEMQHFEEMRKSDPHIDQMVVEHSSFLKQLDSYGDRKNFKNTLFGIHDELLANGEIKETAPKAKIVDLFRKYKKVLLAAACIAGVIALFTSGLVATILTPKSTDNDIEQLKREINSVKISQKQTLTEINNVKSDVASTKPAKEGKFGGTGFLIDGKGILVTSAHVIAKADSVYVASNKGNYYKVSVLSINNNTDVALLKIEDKNFQPYKSIPYTIHKGSSDLGEPVFTLGYPRNEMVYNEGYVSAKTGYNGDTTATQLAISANPGNSGGPIFNETGEVIGVLSGKQTSAEGVVFCSKAKNIFTEVENTELKNANNNIKVNTTSSVKNLNRKQQVKKIEDCIFNVLSY